MPEIKRHRSIEQEELEERLCNEFNDLKDLRTLSLVALLYVEYYVNEILVHSFRHPREVIDDNDLGTFQGKMRIIAAFGVFDGQLTIAENIKLIQRIRNYYAHNLLKADSVPGEVRDRITQLKYVDDDGKVTEFDDPWKEIDNPLQAQLHACAVATINALAQLSRRLNPSAP